MPEFQNVGLEIPVLTTETRYSRHVDPFNLGGRLSRSRGGAVITALQDVTLNIRQGGRVALIGHNGAGKSTFLRLCQASISTLLVLTHVPCSR